MCGFAASGVKNPDDQTEPDDELIRDLFAKFGRAYYHSECLHRELCIALACSELPPPALFTHPRVEELLSRAFSLTLGEVIVKLEGVLPHDVWKNALAAVDRRNFLAHHFWFERVHLMFNIETTRQLIAELDDDTQFFDKLDSRVSEYSKSVWERLGVTAEMQAESLSRVIAGEDDDPLPDKLAIKELNRRLRGKQRLIRVWNSNWMIVANRSSSSWQTDHSGSSRMWDSVGLVSRSKVDGSRIRSLSHIFRLTYSFAPKLTALGNMSGVSPKE